MILMKALKMLPNAFNRVYNLLQFKYYKVKVGEAVKVNGRIRFAGTKGNIEFGDQVIINSGNYDIPIGYPQKCAFWCIDGGKITIGDHSGLSNCSICSMSHVHIGDHVLLGGGVKIYDTDFHSLDYLTRRNIEGDNNRKTKPIIINKDVFVGAGSIILKGTEIGERSVIGAGSVVSGKIPADQVWAGNPARFIRNLSQSESKK